jgi:hypothetical protein
MLVSVVLGGCNIRFLTLEVVQPMFRYPSMMSPVVSPGFGLVPNGPPLKGSQLLDNTASIGSTRLLADISVPL